MFTKGKFCLQFLQLQLQNILRFMAIVKIAYKIKLVFTVFTITVTKKSQIYSNCKKCLQNKISVYTFYNYNYKAKIL